jgi:hypothetical protein
MEDIINFIDFAIEDSTIHHDLDGNPSINSDKFKAILSEYITKRENKVKKQVVAEAKQAIQKILLQ